MTKYTCIKPVGINGTIGYLPGDIVEIKKMKHPIILKMEGKFLTKMLIPEN